MEAAKNKYKRAATEKADGDNDGNWKRRKLDDEVAAEETKESNDVKDANDGSGK